MSKSLEALEDIILYLNASEPKGLYCKNIEIIKKELKRLEKIDNGPYVPIHINKYNELCNKEKALEIIKAKGVNVFNLISYCLEDNFDYEKYVDLFNYADRCFELGYELLTKEEYDLLKEVLL